MNIELGGGYLAPRTKLYVCQECGRPSKLPLSRVLASYLMFVFAWSLATLILDWLNIAYSEVVGLIVALTLSPAIFRFVMKLKPIS